MLPAGVSAASRSAPFHARAAFGPLVVWDCAEGRERAGRSGGGGSLCNEGEAALAEALFTGGGLRTCGGGCRAQHSTGGPCWERSGVSRNRWMC